MPQSATPLAIVPRGAVKFSCASDEDATRIRCLLTSLGYAPTRVVEDSAPSVDATLTRVFAAHGVTDEREQAIACALVEGVHKPLGLSKRIGVSTQSALWLRRSLCVRCHVDDAPAFVALVLAQLDEVQVPE